MHDETWIPRRAGLLRRWLERGVTFLVGGLLVGAGLGASRFLEADRVAPATPEAANPEIGRLTEELAAARGQLAVHELKLDRLAAVWQYSAAYRVPANVAGLIYDAAIAEDIHPSLGFQLVKVESGFRANARSSFGALGYTQVRLKTARAYDSTVSERDLLNPDANLRIGFRILRKLLRQFDGDLELALRAYNLGPTGAVMSLLDSSGSSYVDKILGKGKGERGNGRTMMESSAGSQP